MLRDSPLQFHVAEQQNCHRDPFFILFYSISIACMDGYTLIFTFLIFMFSQQWSVGTPHCVRKYETPFHVSHKKMKYFHSSLVRTLWKYCFFSGWRRSNGANRGKEDLRLLVIVPRKWVVGRWQVEGDWYCGMFRFYSFWLLVSFKLMLHITFPKNLL